MTDTEAPVDFAAMALVGRDVDLLPGSGDDLRLAAQSLRAACDPLMRARDAALGIEAILDGDDWWGQAWQAFVASTNHRRMSTVADNAIAAMEDAAAAVTVLADVHDDHQHRLRSCRWELDQERAAVASGGDATRGLQVLAEADTIHEHHRQAQLELMAVFDRLDDATHLAEPPASLGDQARSVAGNAWDQAWEFGAGVVEASVDLATIAVVLANPLGAAYLVHHLVQNADEYRAMIGYAIDNPGDFAREFAKGMVDLDTLMDNPARWLGKLVPSVVLSLATAGSGMAARGTRAADDAFDAVTSVRRAARSVDDVAVAVPRAATPHDVVDILSAFAYPVGGTRAARSAADPDDECES